MHPLVGLEQDGVEREQIDAEERRRQDDDHRRRIDLLLRRPGDALQLVAHFAEEEACPLESPARRFLDRIESSCSLFSHVRSHFRLLTANFLKDMAGQEGIEPPTPGFGDRCSAN
jgi:hypothetical protein